MFCFSSNTSSINHEIDETARYVIPVFNVKRIEQLSNSLAVRAGDPPFVHGQYACRLPNAIRERCIEKIHERRSGGESPGIVSLFLFRAFTPNKDRKVFNRGWFGNEWAHSAPPQLRFLVRSLSCFLLPRSFEYLTPQLAREYLLNAAARVAQDRYAHGDFD